MLAGETAGNAPQPAAMLPRSCADGASRQDRLHARSETGAHPGAAAPAIVHKVLESSGQPLAPGARAYFEPRIGRDLGDVRIHDGPAAAQSARAVQARAYTVDSHIVLGEGRAGPRLLAHELAHVAQQGGVVRRQSVGGLGDFKPDVCITAPGLGEMCGQKAAEVCSKQSLPGCGAVCAVFGCDKPAPPSFTCPPGWREATSKNFAGQCCKGGIDSAQNCCPAARISFKEDRCCAPGQVVVDDKCSAAPSPLLPCPSGQVTLRGECCLPPEVSLGLTCGIPGAQPPSPTPPAPPGPSLGVLWTDDIHFRQDRPMGGQFDPARILTEKGVAELDSVASWLNLSPDLEVRLIGRASSEGEASYNQALATRRVVVPGAVRAQRCHELQGCPADDGREQGCDRIEDGMWSCGEGGADQEAVQDTDRVAEVSFVRNRLPPLGPLFQPRRRL